MADYTARSSVILNGQQAEDQLEKLGKRAKDLREEMKKLRKANDLSGFKEKERELKEVNKEMRQMKKEAFSVENVLKNLSGASFKEIQTAARKANNEFRAMRQTDPGYKQKAQQVKLLNAKLKELYAQTRAQQSLWGRVSDSFNKYFGIVTAGLASIAGLSFTVRQAIKDFAQFDDKLADVMKTTGLSKDQVKELNEKLKKIDTRTSQEELLELAWAAGKLGITGEEEILGFVRAADQISVALGKDLGGAQEAVRELGKLTDIFKIKDLYGQEQALLKVGSAINELGMASTANEGYLVEFSKRTAGIAPQAGVSIENILGLAATLDALGQKAEMSSTAYSKLMTTMTKKTAEFANIAGMDVAEFSRLMEEDANEAMIRVFEGINKTEGGFQQLVATLGDLGIEGQRMTSVFGALANNTEMLREQQALSNKAFEEGISLTNEFNIKNNTAQANLEKARKAFAEMRRELGEKLIPAYTSVISKARLMMNTLTVLIDFLSKHGRALIVTTAAIAGYTAAVKVAAIWTKIKGAYLATTTALQKAFTYSTGVLTGKIKLATVAQQAWNLAQKANPIGLLVGVLTGAGVALFQYYKKAKQAAEGQKELNDEIQRTDELLGKKQYEQFLQDIGVYTDTLITMADGSVRVVKSFNENINVLDKFGEKVKSLRQNELENFKQFFEDEIVNIQRNLQNIDPNSLQFETDSARMKEYQDALAEVNTELKKFSDARKKLNEDGTEPIDFEAATKALDAAYKQRQLIITQQYENWELTDKEFKAKLWAAEVAYLEQKKALLIQSGQETIDVELQLIQKRLDIVNQAWADLKMKSDEFQKLFDTDMLKADQEEENALTRSINESIKAGEKALAEMKKLKDEEASVMEQRGQIYLNLAQSIGDSFDDLLLSQEASFEQFLKNTLVLALDALEKVLIMSMAEAAIKDIANKGFIGIATAAAKIVLMKAAFAAAKQGIMGGGDKKAKTYAQGKYPVEADDGKTWNARFAGRPKTGIYDGPHLGIFGEVPGQPETVIDGITTRNIRLNFPEIMEAIYAVRDGLIPRFARGKYPAQAAGPVPAELPSSGKSTQPEAAFINLLQENLAMMKELKEKETYLAFTTFEREQKKYTSIKQTSGL